MRWEHIQKHQRFGPYFQFHLIVNRNIVNKVQTIDPIDVAFSENQLILIVLEKSMQGRGVFTQMIRLARSICLNVLEGCQDGYGGYGEGVLRMGLHSII